MPITINKQSEYSSGKIKTEAEIIEIVRREREKGRKVGLCVGGYDLLHPGHMKHLDSAKQLCDILIVGVTADKFNAKRKGDGRPVYSEHLRAFSISQLSSVDFVLISNYEQATELILTIRPNFYIKGPDYISKNTPGISKEREVIKSAGGEIAYTKDETLSTSEVISYIKNNIAAKKSILLISDRDGTIIEEKNFLGKEENWKEELELRMPVINLIKFIQQSANSNTFIITNQSGVARKYFNEERVEEINNYLHDKLKDFNVKIEGWNYCVDVDENYALTKKEIDFDKRFVKSKTKRKPSVDMVLELLSKNNLDMKKFSKIIVLGDKEDDAGLAENLNGHYIDVKNKNFEQLKGEFIKIHE